MTNDRIPQPHPRNPIVGDESRSHLVRPQHNPQRLFSGWGPKL